ncbi:hypothetical protein [Nocardioides marmoribigeumensis]|jgi:hypothetical protein|uniref:Ni/Co efflux regulator RcnB n=1 Tax=Nocardioides marmoribigeumensis TaxID=433649 RepID=A0ABU2BW61_9ACTN|nr:hypothetical protein [Nocardioides marmoribigeumensis]MDR7362511.1 Ni/Co efflux regulator RcnB [Nocardioides marmoribigeumensis]
MSKRTVTRIVSTVVATAALAFSVTAPAAEAANTKQGKHQVIQYKDTGWD